MVIGFPKVVVLVVVELWSGGVLLKVTHGVVSRGVFQPHEISYLLRVVVDEVALVDACCPGLMAGSLEGFRSQGKSHSILSSSWPGLENIIRYERLVR